MIDAKELRIGNWIDVKYVGNLASDIFEAQECNIHNLVDIGLDETLTKVEFEYRPIPLTEEWLVKFGIDTKPRMVREGEVVNLINYMDKRLSFDGSRNLVLCFRNLDLFRGFQQKDIEYVHDLQNLYFALTGTELEIKE